MIVVFIIIFIVLLLSDFFIYFSFIRYNKQIIKILYWIPTIMTFIVLVLVPSGYTNHLIINLLSILLLCISLPKILFSIISIIGLVLLKNRSKGRCFFNTVNVIITAIFSVLMLYGCTLGFKNLVINEQTLFFDTLPHSFDGYKIVQLSDLHLGTYGRSTNFIEKLVDSVNSINPDLIVFTGDIVNIDSGELDPFTNILSRLKSKNEIMSVLGNHDYCPYMKINTPENKKTELEKIKKFESSIGWKLLTNDHRYIVRDHDSISIVGVENCGNPPYVSYSDLPGAMKGIPQGIFTILLTHDPSHWQKEVLPETDIPLTLSGHTHAMQFKLGKRSPASLAYPEWYGLYNKEGQSLFVSNGIGGSLPFRLGAWSEIVVITLRCK